MAFHPFLGKAIYDLNYCQVIGNLRRHNLFGRSSESIIGGALGVYNVMYNFVKYIFVYEICII